MVKDWDAFYIMQPNQVVASKKAMAFRTEYPEGIKTEIPYPFDDIKTPSNLL